MPQYKYSGRDNSGALISGSIVAPSADEVAAQLFGDRITPIEISESARQEKKAAKKTEKKRYLGDEATTMQRVNAFLAGNKVDVDELIMFSRQMYSLTKAGLPLDRAIKGLEASLKNPIFKHVLRDVIASLEGGISLASALGQHPQIFSELFLSLVHVGENTGRLELAFQEIGKYLELEKNTKKKVKSATRYPIFVLIAMAAALAVITVFVIPVFSDAFENFGAELPWQTQLLMDTSDFVINYWPFILFAIFGSIAGAISYTNTESGRLQWDKKKLDMPIFGNVLERIALGRFARSFSMVMSAGLPIVQGLIVVSGAVGNAFIAKNVMKMREGVERGESLHTTASNTNMFSPLVLQMISVGEETGMVDELLREVADFYDAEVEYDIDKLGDSIEPILIVFIAGLVLILALGVFLPIWDLNTAVNG
jgi:MSHA biogenesis protein MshG